MARHQISHRNRPQELSSNQQIRDELSKIDPEYAWVSIRSSNPDEFQLLHPTERPVQESAAAKIDPLFPERNPEPCTIDLHERQTGVSFRRLFGPYLRGARALTLIDPYLRLDYQIYNLMSFIELLEPEDENITLQVTTAAGSKAEEVELSEKLDQVQQGAESKKITFTYTFDQTKEKVGAALDLELINISGVI